MKCEGIHLAETPIENGLVIHFYDQSRDIAGDRRQVQLLICVPMRIEEAWFQEVAANLAEYSEFTAELRGEILFQQTKVRNFVDRENVSLTLDKMKDEFLRANRNYLSNPHFARKFVMKRFEEWKQERNWRRLHAEALLKNREDREV